MFFERVIRENLDIVRPEEIQRWPVDRKKSAHNLERRWSLFRRRLALISGCNSEVKMPGSIHPMSLVNRPSIEVRKRRRPEQVRHEVERTMKFLERREAYRYDADDSDLDWISDHLALSDPTELLPRSWVGHRR
jgi:hypothetical protein